MIDDGRMPEPLPDEIGRLLRSVREIPVAPSMARAQVAQRVCSTLGVPALLSSTGLVAQSAGFFTRAKLLFAFAGVSLVAGGTLVTWRALQAKQNPPTVMAVKSSSTVGTDHRLPAGSFDAQGTVSATNEVSVSVPLHGEQALVALPSVEGHSRVLITSIVASADAGVIAPAVMAIVTSRDAGVARSGRVASSGGVRTTEPPADEADHDLESERVVLESARSAVSRRDGAAALAAVESHRRSFAHGRLAEEREALRVQALVLVGRTAEARRVAGAFVLRFPDSPLEPVVQGAVDTE